MDPFVLFQNTADFHPEKKRKITPTNVPRQQISNFSNKPSKMKLCNGKSPTSAKIEV